jgi:hypothetical protein
MERTRRDLKDLEDDITSELDHVYINSDVASVNNELKGKLAGFKLKYQT